MLSKKFLRDGETPDAASATSGITIEAVSAAAVIPVTAFSFRDALTSSLPLDLAHLHIFYFIYIFITPCGCTLLSCLPKWYYNNLHAHLE